MPVSDTMASTEQVQRECPVPGCYCGNPDVDRNGLVWREGWLGNEPVRVYSQSAPLIVDGITYGRRGAYCEHPMISVRNDSGVGEAGARMRCDKPPTDAELDVWVHKRLGDID